MAGLPRSPVAPAIAMLIGDIGVEVEIVYENLC